MKPKPDATCAFIDAANPTPGPAESTDLDLSFLGPPMAEGELGWLAHYRIYRVLGSGGMGVVLEAEDTHLHRPVALKVMRKELAANNTTRERFLQEARAAAALSSDYIVTVYQVGLANDVPYLAMQFLRGESVQDRLERKGQLPIGEALTIAKQAAMGLTDAHAIGMVHRDIKPANLWLESDGPGDTFKRVRILDFGLARRDSESTRLTATGVVVGTPHFMAPEQASGKTVDGRADLFSLGGVLYTMLTGELAFDGDSVMAVLTALATTSPPRLSDRCPDIPRAVSELVERMLEKVPDRRPASAAEVVAAINAIQQAHPDLNFVPSMSGWATPIASANTDIGGSTTASTVRENNTRKAPSGLFTSTMRELTPAVGQRKSWLAGVMVGAGVVAVALGLLALYMRNRPGASNPPIVAAGDPIVVGVLHSQTGTMALSESPVADATMLAIEEINEAGGLLNRPIKPIIGDGESNPATFATLANQMLNKDGAQAIFGCWTSASRKTVKPVIERFDGLLFYPVQYEGLEQSPRIVYFGSAPNQQLFPAVDFLIDKLGKKKLFLVGSDYVFPRAAHAIIRDRVAQRGGAEIVGEAFIQLGDRDVAAAIENIRRTKPDAIINTINGSTNVFFFKALRAAGIKSEEVPTVSVSVSENMLKSVDVSAMTNDYLVASYFQSVENPAAKDFMRRLQARYGDRVATDAMVSAYSAVHIWAHAVKAAGATDASSVVKHVRGQTLTGPLGAITVDSENQHVWQPVWIGRVRADGQLDIAGGSAECLRPEPWPATRTRQVWERFLNDLYVGWDGHWQPPAKP